MACSAVARPIVPLLHGWVQMADDHVLTFGNVMPAFYATPGHARGTVSWILLQAHDEKH